MKKHLKIATDDYVQEPIDGIRPISAIDAEIIETLIRIAGGINNKDLKRALERWKVVPDVDVLDELNGIEDSLDATSATRNSIDYITIGSFTIKVQMLASIEPFDDYDYKKNRPVYKIILNRDERSKIVFANAEIEFSSAEERRLTIERLRDRLREFANVRFL